MNQNVVKIVFTASILLICISNCTAAENEFGIVTAWSNDEPATVEGMVLKINEPFTVKATIESKIDGNIYVLLSEPGVTTAYEVIEGPSEIDEFIDNMNIESGWKTTYIWKLKPNGDWTNGNAPINLFVQFNKAHDDVQKIRFTVANPQILDEQYSGFYIIPTADPSSTNQTPSQGSSGFGVVSALLGILLAVVYRAGRA
ncbi:MAG: sarcinarray family MAST domain-containing protein [Methanosarcinales archaeon]|nr:sarcinarray family MAST domain-containing protein [Methanosarcinales archaeon]